MIRDQGEFWRKKTHPQIYECNTGKIMIREVFPNLGVKILETITFNISTFEELVNSFRFTVLIKSLASISAYQDSTD